MNCLFQITPIIYIQNTVVLVLVFVNRNYRSSTTGACWSILLLVIIFIFSHVVFAVEEQW